MQIQPVNNKYTTPNFCGFLKVNKALREFKMSLNDAQQDLFENNIMKMEKEKDGRVFKFDKINDEKVGIFEKFNHPLAKKWAVILEAPKEKSVWCFDELNKIYRDMRFAKFIEKTEK
jgi:hypothetical protein